MKSIYLSVHLLCNIPLSSRSTLLLLVIIIDATIPDIVSQWEMVKAIFAFAIGSIPRLDV